MNYHQPKTSELPKFFSALKALDYVEDGMKLGLGTGSTAYWFVVLLAHRIHTQGLKVTCVTTSSQTWAQAESLNVPLTTLGEIGELDLVVDGADEADFDLNLIKGGGAALLQEKIVANASKQMFVIADDSKLVEKLGKFHLPIEVVKFGWQATQRAVEALLDAQGITPSKVGLREKDGALVETDEQHYLLDCYCNEIPDAPFLAGALNLIPGVVENGLFINMADKLILGTPSGKVMLIERGSKSRDEISLEVPEGFRENLD